MIHFNYRPEIDGLRAIAVLSVVIAHANAQWLPNGILGVDVFFVISGFLITQIIYHEMTQNTFSFIEFYKRRAKRILPALLLVLAITTIFISIIFIKQDFIDYLKSIRSTLLFSVNIFFAKDIDYFDITSQEKPLLHLWSLAIEEQFYFIFPIILLLSIKFLKKKYIIWLILTCIVLSLLSQFIPSDKQQYYLPHIRAYELLIGCLFAILPRKSLPISIQWTALLAILIIFFLPKVYFSIGHGYIERLLVCVSTALLLNNNNSSTTPLTPNKLLSHPFFIFFGLISYSLYLWHWVIFAILRYVYMPNELPLTFLFSVIFISIILAYLTYKVVENPIRKIKNFTDKKFLLSILGYVVVIIFISVFIHFYKKIEDNIVPQHLVWEKHICYDKYSDMPCLQGDISLKTPTILAIGDSHSAQYNQFFNYLGQKEHWLSSVISAHSCPFLIEQRRPIKENLADKKTAINCNNYRDFIDTQIQYYDTIFLLGYWEKYIPSDNDETQEINFLTHFEKTLQYLLHQHKTIYVFADNPTISVQGTRYYYLTQKGLSFILPKLTISSKSAKANQLMKNIVKKYPQIIWVDLNPYIPKDFMINGLPIYRDDDHINPYGARKIAEHFAEKEILIKKVL
ncbi:O-acetyltransferase OatA [[Pasteurella] aerogenes]|nr:O-acetyltransferase OatA [[Pasteurella] aerogenes]